jgi:nuclear pore complex protein Nup205
MFDFIVLDPPEAVTPPSDYFIDLDFSVCLLTGPDEPAIYDAARVQSLLLLRLHEYENSGRFRTEDDGSTFNYEALNLLQYVQAKNDETRLAAARIETLKAWTQVIMMIVVTGQLQGTNHLKFITDAIVVVQSRLERHATQDLEETQLLASLAKFLLFKIDINSKSFKNDDTGHHANERLYQLFSISLRAIQSPTTSSLLRETFYTICYRYLSTVSQFADRSSKARKHTLQTVKACGEGLLATICDDAYAGEVNCRVAALMLLTVFEDIAQLEGQKYISEALIRVNFLSLVVDSLKSILDDLNSLSKESML